MVRSVYGSIWFALTGFDGDDEPGCRRDTSVLALPAIWNHFSDSYTQPVVHAGSVWAGLEVLGPLADLDSNNLRSGSDSG